MIPLDAPRAKDHNPAFENRALPGASQGKNMTEFKTGDLVVLISGSMRMAVEAVEGENVACVWCNEGEIGRDNFNALLLRKWEHREDHEERRSGRDDRGGGKPRQDRGERGGDRKPKGKTGWDGKPREKKYFRKED